MVPVANVEQSKANTPSTVNSTDISKYLPKKPHVVPEWRPTPSTNNSNLIKHYMKLSKIRLTSKLMILLLLNRHNYMRLNFCKYIFKSCSRKTNVSCSKYLKQLLLYKYSKMFYFITKSSGFMCTINDLFTKKRKGRITLVIPYVHF